MMLALSLTLSLTACRNQAGSEYHDDILPTQDQLAINLKGGDAEKSPSDPEDWASYYEATRSVTSTLNGMIAFVLGTVGYVTTNLQPSWTDEDKTKAMWGPYSDSGLDPHQTGLYVIANEDESYSWAIFFVPNGGTVEEDAVPVVAGEVDAGSTREDATGTFVVDFTTANAMDPAVRNVGTFAVEYDYDAAGVEALASMDDFGNEGGIHYDAAYHYDEDYAGSGTMDLAWLDDVNATGTSEIVTLESRWTEDGAGRGDAMVQGGDLGAENVTASECWGTDFKTSFWTDSIGMYEPVGEESVCAYTPASYSEEGSFELSTDAADTGE